MNEFYDDVRDKKRTAASARHMVCGSRSQKVSLPSDGMTKAELEKMNGPVMTYNLKQPMAWERLLAMPADLQKRYIEGLRKEYNANSVAIAQMLGVHANTLRALTASLGITFPRGGGANMSAADREKWQAFLAGQPVQEKTEPEAEKVPTDEAPPRSKSGEGRGSYDGRDDNIPRTDRGRAAEGVRPAGGTSGPLDGVVGI